jgi:hypothetical protein
MPPATAYAVTVAPATGPFKAVPEIIPAVVPPTDPVS